MCPPTFLCSDLCELLDALVIGVIDYSLQNHEPKDLDRSQACLVAEYLLRN